MPASPASTMSSDLRVSPPSTALLLPSDSRELADNVAAATPPVEILNINFHFEHNQKGNFRSQKTSFQSKPCRVVNSIQNLKIILNFFWSSLLFRGQSLFQSLVWIYTSPPLLPLSPIHLSPPPIATHAAAHPPERPCAFHKGCPSDILRCRST